MISTLPGLLLSFASPLLLMPIEYFLPYPHIVEELTKMLIVRMTKGTLLTTVIAGVLFSVSESMFYLMNILEVGDISRFPLRLITVGSMHTITFCIHFIGRKGGKIGILLAFGVTVMIHYWYNTRYVPQLTP